MWEDYSGLLGLVTLAEPDLGYVYRLWAANEIVYVGKTCTLASRLASHAKDKPWWRSVSKVDAFVGTIAEMDRKETEEIHRLHPRHNLICPVPGCGRLPRFEVRAERRLNRVKSGGYRPSGCVA